ncbi:MAG TPA: hypothetical protein VKA15_16380 [Isosphaeraceae bacterium]|nr:hypothetical protein [Isosphaeraceae bacterium]
MLDKPIKITDAARLTGKYPLWVRRKIVAGELRATIADGRTYIDPNSLADLLAKTGRHVEAINVALQTQTRREVSGGIGMER